LPGTALVVNFGSAAMIGEGSHSDHSPRKFVESEMTTKAVSSAGAPKAVAISGKSYDGI
jgi:hypothetical protein